MVFNIKQKTLTFIKNHKDNGIAYSDIDTTKIYSMAVSVNFIQNHEGVELTQFNIYYS